MAVCDGEVSFVAVVMCDAVVLARHICSYITFFSLILGKAYGSY
jgi:hypothetical protein